MTELFILAGGEGSRFFPFTALTPKCLIPVAGKPCIRWIVDDAIEQDCFHSIVICINKKDQLEYEHEFRDLDIVSLSVSEKPLGTMGELLNAMPIIDDNFCIRYGDDLTDVDYKKLRLIHNRHKASVTLAVTTKYELPIGTLELSGHIVKKFLEKPHLDKPIWTGVAYINYDKARPFFVMGDDIARDTIPKMLAAEERVVAYDTKSSWHDIGNIEHWRKSNEIYRKTKTNLGELT